jgi:hypothetical protein
VESEEAAATGHDKRAGRCRSSGAEVGRVELSPVLYCTVPYCTILYHTVPYCQSCTVLYGLVSFALGSG